jgi:membrane associated rhomboid family serine protease
VGSHCLDCAKAARPDAATRVKLASSRFAAPVTYGIIVVNLVVFVWIIASSGSGLSGGLTQGHVDLGLSKVILQGGASYGGVPIPPHQWYRLVTSGFIHFGVFHILMNMLLLFQLGGLLERALGGVRFGMLYAACLLAGSVGVLVLDSAGVTGGASGAVFGLMAAAAVGLQRRGINVFSTGIGTTLLINLVLTFSIRGISIGGHLGGVVGGAICGWFMLAPVWKQQPKWMGMAVPAAVAVLSVIASVVLVSA